MITDYVIDNHILSNNKAQTMASLRLNKICIELWKCLSFTTSFVIESVCH